MESTKVETGETDTFQVGHKFFSNDKLNKEKSKYERTQFCELYKRDLRTLESARKRVPKRVANANPSLHSSSLKLTCKFGGKNTVKSEQQKRNTTTFRQGCPFEINISLSTKGKALEVMKVTTAHNHNISPHVYEHLPRQRCLSCS